MASPYPFAFQPNETSVIDRLGMLLDVSLRALSGSHAPPAEIVLVLATGRPTPARRLGLAVLTTEVRYDARAG